MYLRVDFWQWIDRIDPPTSFHSVFQQNPFQQQEKEHKKGIEWWVGLKMDLKKNWGDFCPSTASRQNWNVPFLLYQSYMKEQNKSFQMVYGLPN